tara:strand:+ start:348 stop:569 length:222 start_codon:yes stop_codon:yes gene_type:complete
VEVAGLVVVEEATGTGMLVVDVGTGGFVRLAVIVGVEGVADGSSEVQEVMINTRVAARARPVDRPVGIRGRSR